MKKIIDISEGQIPSNRGKIDPRVYELPVEPVPLYQEAVTRSPGVIHGLPEWKQRTAQALSAMGGIATIVAKGALTVSSLALDVVAFVLSIVWTVVTDLVLPLVRQNFKLILTVWVGVLVFFSLKILLALKVVQVGLVIFCLSGLLIMSVVSLPRPRRTSDQDGEQAETTIRAEVNIDTREMKGKTTVETKINIK